MIFVRLRHMHLNAAGFEIEEFEDAKALYERLEKKTPDLFLLDVMLPDEDGLEIVKKLRAMPADKAFASYDGNGKDYRA